MANLPKGTKVQQVIKPLVGEVTGYQVDQESGELLYLVDVTELDGDHVSRYFKADEIQPITE